MRLSYAFVLMCGFCFRSGKGVFYTGCAADKWQCANGPCIYLLSRCDSFLDCLDGSEEWACLIIDICSEGRRACANGQCIPGRLFCDGTVNCFDGSDELCGPDGRKGTPSSPTMKPQLTAAPTPLPVPPRKRATVRHVEEDSPEVEAVISEATTEMMTTPTATTFTAPTTTVTPTTTTTTITTPMTTKTPATTTTTTTTQTKAAAVPFWWGLTAGTTSPIPKTTTPSHVNCIRVEDYGYCRKRYRGYFIHPTNCQKFIVCEWGFQYICVCPTKTLWEQSHLTCVWASDASCNQPRYEVVQLTTATTTTTSVPPTPKPRVESPVESLARFLLNLKKRIDAQVPNVPPTSPLLPRPGQSSISTSGSPKLSAIQSEKLLFVPPPLLLSHPKPRQGGQGKGN